MNKNQRKNRPRKKEKSDRQWSDEFRELKRRYAYGGGEEEGEKPA